MSYFAARDELEEQLVACLEAFVGSPEGARACELAGQQGTSLELRTYEPEALVSVDFGARSVAREPVAEPSVRLELEADALHDILLERLGPVEISRLYETDRARFSGAPEHLATLVAIAGALQPFYPASLAERGRADLLDTPRPTGQTVWGAPEDALDPKRVIGKPRPWQRPKRAAAERQ